MESTTAYSNEFLMAAAPGKLGHISGRPRRLFSFLLLFSYVYNMVTVSFRPAYICASAGQLHLPTPTNSFPWAPPIPSPSLIPSYLSLPLHPSPAAPSSPPPGRRHSPSRRPSLPWAQLPCPARGPPPRHRHSPPHSVGVLPASLFRVP